MMKPLDGDSLKPFHYFLDCYFRAYETLEPGNLDDFWASDLHIIGTGSDEWYVTKEQCEQGIKRDFSELGLVKIEYDQLNGFAGSDMACLCCTVYASYLLKGSQESLEMPSLRFTFFLVREDESWKVQHLHASGALSVQPVGKSYPLAD